MTYTYALLPVSRACYYEIAKKLREADYHQAFHAADGRVIIDMQGIALDAEVPAVDQASCAHLWQLRTDGRSYRCVHCDQQVFELKAPG